MKRALKVLLAVVIASIFVYTIYFLYEKSQAKPVVYETTTPVKMNIIKSTMATGSVVPRKEVEISEMRGSASPWLAKLYSMARRSGVPGGCMTHS